MLMLMLRRHADASAILMRADACHFYWLHR